MTNDEYRKMILDKIREVLKPIGFKKQGNHFLWNINDVVCIVHFQSSAFSTQNDLTVTVNLGIFSFPIAEKIDYDGKPRIYSSHWQERIGIFTPKKTDVWWDIKNFDKAEKVGEEISQILQNIILPFFETVNSTEKLRHFWEKDKSRIIHFYDGRRYLHLLK